MITPRPRFIGVPRAAWLVVIAGCAATPTIPNDLICGGGEAPTPAQTPAAATAPAPAAPTAPGPAAPTAPGPAAPTALGPGDGVDLLTASASGLLPEGKTGFGSDKSYVIPAVEILGYEFLLNQYDRNFISERTYGSDAASIDKNLHHAWVIDNDPFSINQLAHPYSGSLYHGFARSAGLNYWESLGYTLAGSAIWEVAGETTPPSLNDQIATGVGGSFLGEALFRTANWVLERGGSSPGFGRELGAAALSPPNWFNRHVFGSQFRSLFTAEGADVKTRADFGAKATRLEAHGLTPEEERTDGIARFQVDYGMPGKTDYHYSHPFDYFHMDIEGSTDVDNHVDHVLVSGLLIGTDYKWGGAYDGIWGLYGDYAYVSPGTFRLASTAVSVGTTAQDRVSDSVTLQGSLLAGLGFGAAGTIADDQSDRDYHYGLSPQGLLDFRCIFGDRAMLQLTGRDFEIGGSGYNHNGGRENVLQVEASMTLRVWGPHSISIQGVGSWRDARYGSASQQNQQTESLALVYTFLGGTQLGAVR